MGLRIFGSFSKASILAESPTTLKLSFNRPDQDLARPEPADHFVVIFFLSSEILT
jgi:hypothetical protein